MKKLFLLLAFVLFASSMLTGCLTMLAITRASSVSSSVYNKFYGSSNPNYGYEGFFWGTNYETIKEKTGWDISHNIYNSYYIIGKNYSVFDFYSSHGDRHQYISSTRLHFSDNMLYAAEDEFSKTPSLSFLHEHYGDFSEENVAQALQKKYQRDYQDRIIKGYRGQQYSDFTYSLEIIIFERGTTIVKLNGDNSLFTARSMGDFRANCNPTYGYEDFAWGTSYETIKEKSGWNITQPDESFFTNHRSPLDFSAYKKRFNYFMNKHGQKGLFVDRTLLYFNENRLYAVQDEFNKVPSIDFLHKRYGEFSEENVVTLQQRSEGIVTVYKGQNYFDSYALEVFIYKNGETFVKLCEPYFEKSINEGNPLNKWICYSVADPLNKRIDFTFLNKSTDGKCLFVGYSRSSEHPSFSYIRSGICWGDNTSGAYDIKGDTGVLSKSFSTDKWKCLYNNKEYTYTNNVTESPRAIVELFVASQKVMVRHNNVVSEFSCSGGSLLDKMAEYGITWEEIDNAMANEEF